MKKKLQTLPSLFSGALICAAFMLIIYALKGIWPFGTGDVTYNDMAQGSLPMHYHIYDWLHGEKALDFDWYTGLGMSVSNSASFSPFHLIMLFFKRENLLYSLGILVIAYISAAAVTSKFVFDKLFTDVNQLWRTLFSVMYAMSSYCMFYYTNTSWLNFVVVFPLIIYGLKLLFIDNKPLCYTLMFAYVLYLSVYQGFMITLAVFLLSGFYLVLIAPRETRAQRTCTLGISTFVGAMLSAWHSVPMALQTLASKRLQTSSITKENFYLKLLDKQPYGQIFNKTLFVVGLQLTIVLVVFLFVRLLKEKKYKKAGFVFLSAFAVISPVFFENINLLWHLGSYVGFPMRFFYVTVFVFLMLALYALQKYGENIFRPTKKAVGIITGIGTVVLVPVFTLALSYFLKLFDGTSQPKNSYSYVIYCFVIATGIALFALLLSQKKHITRAFCFVICLVQTFAAGYAGIANNKEKVKEELLYNSSSFVEYCNEASALDTDCGVLGKIKNADTSLNTNYPMLLKSPALSNWTHNIPQSLQKSVEVLGYSSQYTRLLDSGGTAFTDGIFGVKKLVQRNHHTVTDQYELTDSTENFNLYENKYAVEFGLFADEELLEDITDIPLLKRFEVQNRLWKIFTDSDEELFEICTEYEDSENISLIYSSESKLIFSYTAKQDSLLYMNTGKYVKQSYKTNVNGERIMGPYNKQTTYGYFPSAAVNGLLTLGSFKAGETAEIVISCINGETFKSDIQLGCMPLEKMAEFSTLYKDMVFNEKTEKSALSFEYNNSFSEPKYVFIPVSYDKGWSCEINGVPAEIHKALGAFMAVELPEGKGEVKFSFRSHGESIGVIITAIGAVLFAVLMLIMRKYDYKLPTVVEKTVFVLFAAAVILAICGIYLVPTAFSLKNYIDLIIDPEARAQWLKQ